MNDDKSSLAALRERLENARIALNVVGMTNVTGKTTQELIELDIESRKADQNYMAAQLAYRNALEAEIKKREGKDD